MNNHKRIKVVNACRAILNEKAMYINQLIEKVAIGTRNDGM